MRYFSTTSLTCCVVLIKSLRDGNVVVVSGRVVCIRFRILTFDFLNVKFDSGIDLLVEFSRYTHFMKRFSVVKSRA